MTAAPCDVCHPVSIQLMLVNAQVNEQMRCDVLKLLLFLLVGHGK